MMRGREEEQEEKEQYEDDGEENLDVTESRRM